MEILAETLLEFHLYEKKHQLSTPVQHLDIINPYRGSLHSVISSLAACLQGNGRLPGSPAVVQAILCGGLQIFLFSQRQIELQEEKRISELRVEQRVQTEQQYVHDQGLEHRERMTQNLSQRQESEKVNACIQPLTTIFHMIMCMSSADTDFTDHSARYFFLIVIVFSSIEYFV